MPQYLEYGFQGRTAIITGGGTGMGEACAVELAKGGAKVAVFGRRLAPIEKVRDECAKYTEGAMALQVDVSDEHAVRNGVEAVAAAFGRIDILINNAGIEVDYKPGEMPFVTHFDVMGPEEYLSFFKIHTLGHYLMNLAVIPYMQKAHFGRILNITSVTGISGGYGCPAYTSSKAAANLQTKAFAKKYGKENITVNGIAPGMINTPMKTMSPPEEFAAVARATALGRVGEPIDIARAALFFVQENQYVTGQVLVVDGGSN